jgi:hypothetical protein
VFALLVFAGALATRALIGSGRAGRLRPVPSPENGKAPREGVVR